MEKTKLNHDGIIARQKNRFPLGVVVIVLLSVLMTSIILSIALGAVKIEAGQVADILLHKFASLLSIELQRSEEVLASSRADIIWNIRFPRVLMAVAVGAGLSISGVVMQAVVRNPLATPMSLASLRERPWAPPWRLCWAPFPCSATTVLRSAPSAEPFLPRSLCL